MYIQAVARRHLWSSQEVRSISSTCISFQQRLALGCIFDIWISVLTLTFFLKLFFWGFCPMASGPLFSKQSFVNLWATVMWNRVYAHCCSSPSPAVTRGAQHIEHLYFFSTKVSFLVFKHIYWQSSFLKIGTLFFWNFGPAATRSGPPAWS